MSFFREAPNAARRILGVVLLLTAAVYVPHLSNGLLAFDDRQLILDNPIVQDPSLRMAKYAFTSYDPELYVPLTMISYQIEHAMFGDNPTVYHATNLLLHLLSVVLVASILWRLTGSPVAATIGAALFALHPIQTEGVLWAAARKDTLSNALGLASFDAFLRHRETGRSAAYAASVSFFLLALLSKVSVAILPAAYLFLDLFRTSERPSAKSLVKTHAPLFALSAFFIGVALYGKVGNLSATPPFMSFLLFLKGLTRTAISFVWPFDLAMLYPHTATVALTRAEFLTPLIVVIALLVAAFVRRHRLWAFCVVFAILMMLPGIAAVTRNAFLFVTSDRYAYLAGVGVFCLVGLLADRLWDRGGTMRNGVIAGSAIVLCGLAVLTFRQGSVWASDLTLFAHNTAHFENAAMAWNNLGVQQTLAGDKAAGQASFERAIAVAKNYTIPYRNIADIHFKAGDMRLTTEWYERALQALRAYGVSSQDDLDTYFAYAQLLIDTGRSAEGLALLEEAVERAPQSPKAHHNLGIAYRDQRRPLDAMAEFEASLALQFRNADGWYFLASLYAEHGRLPEAAEALENTLFLDPGNEKAAEHLAKINAML